MTESAMVKYEDGVFDIPEDAESADALLDNFAKNTKLPDHTGLASLQVNGNTGAMTAGRAEREAVSETARFAVDVGSFVHGYRIWLQKPDGSSAGPETIAVPESSETLEEVFARLPPKSSYLPNVPSNNGDYKKARGFRCLGLTENVAGLPLEVLMDSAGAVGEIEKLMAAIAKQKTIDPKTVYPIVTVSPQPFTTKKFKSKTSYKPVFNILGWTNPAGFRAELKRLQGGEEPPPETKEDVIDVESKVIEETTTPTRRRK